VNGRFILSSQILGAASVALAAVFSSAASAQEVRDAATERQATEEYRADKIAKDREISEQEVSEREQEGYSPLGMRLGSFLLNPGAELRATYTDNLYATSNDRSSDYYTTIVPSLLARSDWNVHELEFWASADIFRYRNHHADNVEDYQTYLRGKYDIARASWISVMPQYESGHEDRGDPNAIVSAVSPTETTTKSLEIKGEHRPTRLWLGGDLTASDVSFDNTKLTNGAITNNKDRDLTVLDGGVLVGYEIIPGYSAYVEGRINDREYDVSVDDSGFRRDSSGYEARAGAEIELTGTLKGNVFLGYMWQSYDDARFEKLTKPVYGADLTWNATGLTTVKLSGFRTIEETTTANAAGYLADSFEISADHELLRNVILSTGAEYTRNAYRGTNRTTDGVEGTLGAKYRLNRNYTLEAEYTYFARQASDKVSEYHKNTIFVGLSALF